MLRITQLFPDGASPTLKLEGRIAGPWVEEVSRAVGEALATAPRVVLEMSGVTFVDRPGVELLRALGGSRAELRGGSHYVTELLEEHGDDRSRRG